MCGIVGAVRLLGGEPPSPDLVAGMRDAMAHRGPDGAGLWADPNRDAVLGHRRLSIIDLSDAASQPMASPDGRYVLTFNGEIYNHAELRRQLCALSVNDWRTDHSDTEVLLYAFRQWGPAALQRLRGMFALAIWDTVERRLFLARDRAGIKPLYFSKRDSRFSFASEIKALLVDPRQPRRLDETSLFHYLSFLTTPAPATMFAGIQKLEAGVAMTVYGDGSVMQKRYWDPLAVSSRTDVAFDLAAEELLECLRDSVAAHAVSDVPVGVFLSGGVDSSTNAALFSQVARQKVRSFSVGYAGEQNSWPNELEWAHLAARAVGAEQRDIVLTVDDLFAFLPRMAELQDEPVADPVAVPTYYLSKLARDSGVAVCQVGEGSDELFWGYPAWRPYLDLERANALPLPGLARGLLTFARASAVGDRATRDEVLRRRNAGQPVFWSGAEGFTDAEKRRLLSPRLRRQFEGRTSWEAIAPIWHRYQEHAQRRTSLGWMSYVDLNLRLPELLLMRVDKMTMGASLEARVPYLDHRLINLALSLPQRVVAAEGMSKPLLRKAVRGVVPDAIVDRPKQGFWLPLMDWFNQGLRERMRDALDRFCAESDLLDADGVHEVLNRGRELRCWCLFNLALWHQAYMQ
jgi:asparagine synthase (glutamine-hydrolysing)